MSDSTSLKTSFQESYENLGCLNRELVGLEKNPRDTRALASVFRTIHTIKGACGFLGFDKFEKVAHVGENLLTRLRDGKLLLNPEITTGLLNGADAVRQMLKEIESTGHDGDDAYAELLETLTGLRPIAAPTTQPAASSDEVCCLAFDVTPLCEKNSDRFWGGIWLKDRGYTIARFNGANSCAEHLRGNRLHFDSSRLNVGPGVRGQPTFTVPNLVLIIPRSGSPIEGGTRTAGQIGTNRLRSAREPK